MWDKLGWMASYSFYFSLSGGREVVDSDTGGKGRSLERSRDKISLIFWSCLSILSERSLRISRCGEAET